MSNKSFLDGKLFRMKLVDVLKLRQKITMVLAKSQCYL